MASNARSVAGNARAMRRSNARETMYPGLSSSARAVASRQACAAANAASWFESRSRSFAGTFLKYSSRHESQAS